MKKVLAPLFLVLVLAFAGVYEVTQRMPSENPNSVLAEKSSVVMGGQAAVLIPNNLTRSQHQVLNIAYSIAKADGHKNPELVQGILLQESKAGGMSSYKVAGNKGDEYFGLMGIKKGAALDVLKRHPELYKKYKFQTRSDDELKANLILNGAFNIEIGSKYLLLLREKYNLTGNSLIVAYNRGPSGVNSVEDVNSHHYLVGVRAKLAHAGLQ